MRAATRGFESARCLCCRKCHFASFTTPCVILVVAYRRLRSARAVQQELREENGGLHAQVATLESRVTEESSARAAEAHINAELKKENGRLRTELAATSASLEQTRIELRGQVERLARERRIVEGELESQIAHSHALREQQVAHLTATSEQQRLEHLVCTANLQAQLRAAHAERDADADHFTATIERQQALQAAVLKAGSARGRQLLYTESLRAPEISSSISWRGQDTRDPHASTASSPLSTARSGVPRSRSPPTAQRSSRRAAPSSARDASSVGQSHCSSRQSLAGCEDSALPEQ